MEIRDVDGYRWGRICWGLSMVPFPLSKTLGSYSVFPWNCSPHILKCPHSFITSTDTFLACNTSNRVRLLRTAPTHVPTRDPTEIQVEKRGIERSLVILLTTSNLMGLSGRDDVKVYVWVRLGTRNEKR
jgi:hypothetical protein